MGGDASCTRRPAAAEEHRFLAGEDAAVNDNHAHLTAGSAIEELKHVRRTTHNEVAAAVQKKNVRQRFDDKVKAQVEVVKNGTDEEQVKACSDMRAFVGETLCKHLKLFQWR